jgi:hypothetical protein
MFRAAMCPSSGELIVSIRHLVYVTLYRCLIDTFNSPDGGHMAARSTWRIEISMHEKELCVKLVIYKDIFVLYEKLLYKILGLYHLTSDVR